MEYNQKYSSYHSTIIYVENSYNVDFNNIIAANYNSINQQLSYRNIQFLYLPLLMKNHEYREILGYNRPYLAQTIDPEQISGIYSGLKNRLSDKITDEGLIWINKNKQLTSGFFGFQLDKDKSILSQIKHYADWIDKQTILLQAEEPRVMCKKIRDYDNEAPLFKRPFNSDSRKSQTNFDKTPLLRQIQIIDDPDETFNIDAFKLADEIIFKIQQLKESGSIQLLDDIIEEVLNVRNKLSSLFITNDYRIFLKDYNMKEVEMSPLPKALYFLFLRHPEGILFKHLQNYRDELMTIYKNVTTFVDIDRAMESINAMSDPCNNSINENCSRIRAAFLRVIKDELALNYYITGRKGEPKGIILNRSLVTYQ